MTSPEKINANRLNAQRSTGPKTASGKHKSAANSWRHGLSTPLEPELMGPKRAMVARLIVQDDIDPRAVLDLADKIVEYERNLDYQRNLFVVVYVECAYEPEAMERDFLENTPELDMLKELIDHQRCVVGRVNLRDLAFVTRKTMRLRRSWMGWQERAAHKQKSAAKRYMRRSTNQLIKALKSV